MASKLLLRSPSTLAELASKPSSGRVLAQGFRLTNIRRDAGTRCLSASAARLDRVLEADSPISWRPETPIQLNMEPTGAAAWEPKLVQSTFRRVVEWNQDRRAMAIKRGGDWVYWTYKDYERDVHRAAKGFHKVRGGRK